MIKLIKKITDIVFVLIIIALAGYFVLRSMGKLEIFEVETGSMEDGIHPGDYVLILQKELYVTGDIVTYAKDGYYITHRIIKIDSEGIVTKGDANNTEDEKIDKSAIVGKVIMIGGPLNIVINYKFAIVSLFLALYLFSSYFAKDKDEELDSVELDKEKEDEVETTDENTELTSELVSEETKTTEVESIKIEEVEVKEETEEVKEKTKTKSKKTTKAKKGTNKKKGTNSKKTSKKV